MDLINLVSDSNSSDDDELPDINIPSSSYNKEPDTEQTDDTKSDETSSDSLHELPGSFESLTTQLANTNNGNGGKRGKSLKNVGDKEAKKRKIAEEKAARQQKMQFLNTYKPAQCMKHMIVEVHPTLSSAWYMCDVAREVAAAGARLHAVPTLAHPALLVWTRTLPQTLVDDGGQVRLSPSRQHCDMSLYLCTAEELAEMLADNSLLSHVRSLRQMLDGDMSMIVFGDCFKSSGRKTSNSNRKQITEVQLDKAKIDLLFETGVDMQVIEKQSDLVMWVVQCTRAVAEAPYKKLKRDMEAAAADFYIKGDKKKCVAVNKEGQGLNRLWQQMIAVLPSSSLEIARALCSKYKTPIQLMETLETSEGVAEVADIPVTRTAVPGSKSRRIGPEFARKLQLLYTSNDPNILVE